MGKDINVKVFFILIGKTKKDTLKEGSPKQRKDKSWKPEAEALMLAQSRLERKAPEAEQCKTRVMPSEDSPVSSSGHQQEQTATPKKNLKSSKNLQSTSKTSQPVVHKKQTAEQKLQSDIVAKKRAEGSGKKIKKSGKKNSNKKTQLQKESSDSEPHEEELEREPVKLIEVFTSPLHEKLQTSVSQKAAESEKPKNLLHALESVGGASKSDIVKAVEYLLDSVKKSEKKGLSAKSSRKVPKKIGCRTSEGVCSNPEDPESQMDSDSSSIQDTARKKQKLSDVKIKNNKRKRNMQHGLQ